MATNTTAYAELNTFQIVTATLAIYNSVEVLTLVFLTFSKYDSLCFWSLLGSATGIILFVGGFVDLFYKLYEDGRTAYEPLFILTAGWYGMVTGFALVLLSRLHLIGVPRQYITYCKYMICYNIVFSHFPTTVLTFGSNIDGGTWTTGTALWDSNDLLQPAGDHPQLLVPVQRAAHDVRAQVHQARQADAGHQRGRRVPGPVHALGRVRGRAQQRPVQLPECGARFCSRARH